jgi:hypothetical protein
MQIENDYDKEVYNGDIGYLIDVNPDAGDLTTSFDDRSVSYGLAKSTRWCRPTRRPFTTARARNIRPW